MSFNRAWPRGAEPGCTTLPLQPETVKNVEDTEMLLHVLLNLTHWILIGPPLALAGKPGRGDGNRLVRTGFGFLTMPQPQPR